MIYLLSNSKIVVRRYFYTFLLVICSTFYLSAQTLPSSEYQEKAVFILNFTQFIKWPDSAFTAINSPLIIGVLGENPFDFYLEEKVKGENANGHPLIVQYYKNFEDIKTCHLLFINLPEKTKQEEVLKNLRGLSILSVTDDPDLSKQKEVIKFYKENNKIQFQINTEAAKDADLVISSKLLNIAKIFISPSK